VARIAALQTDILDAFLQFKLKNQIYFFITKTQNWK